MFILRPAACSLRPDRAFSLVELVIALAVLTVGLVGAIRVFPVGLRASQRAEWQSRAALLAQRTLESAKLAPWDTLVVGSEEDAQDGPFSVRTRVRAPLLEGVTDATAVKAVEVTVEWRQDGRAREIVFLTFLWRGAS